MLKEDEIVICKVTKIEGTTIFVEIKDHGPGEIVMSEIAAGRIRNLRDYVSPGREIVCKVLKILQGRIELSLRRVTSSEKEQALQDYKKEKTFTKILEKNTKDYKKAIEKMQSSGSLAEFYDKARENPKALEKFVSKSESEALARILTEKKEKEKEVREVITLKSSSPTGLEDLKEILKIEDIEIHYLGSSKFSISTKAKDFKEANQKIESAIKEIEKKAKKLSATLEVKSKK